LVGICGAVLAGPAQPDDPCDVVGGTGTAHPTVTGLLAAMGPGQTGCLHGYPQDAQPSNAGLYEEQVTISEAGVTLRSHPGEVAQIKGRLSIAAAGVTVSHLVLDGRNASGHTSPRISQHGDGARLVDNVITSRSTTSCGWVDGTEADRAENVVIQHNRIHDCNVAVIVERAHYTAVMQNLIYDNAGTAVRLAPNADGSGVWRNVIDTSGNGVQIGAGSDANYVGMNVIANPRIRTLDFWPQPGTYNVFGSNCVWKDGGDGVDHTYTTTQWEFDKVVLTPNRVADPGYEGAASEGDHTIAGTNGCHAATGDMSPAVSDNERPHREQAVNLRPNVLVIVSDDQRADTMDVMPKTVARLRGPDGAGGGGTEYQQAFVTTPLCCPARSSLLSGRYAHNHLVKTNGAADPPKLTGSSLLPRYLKQAGYRTGLYGKYLNFWPSTWRDSDQDGVFQWEGGLIHSDQQSSDPSAPNYAVPGVPTNFDDFGLASGGGVMRESVTGPPVVDPDDTAYVLGRGADFVSARESEDGKPWFLYLAPQAPHEVAVVTNGSSTSSPPRNSERWGTDAWHRMTDGTPYAGADVRGYEPPVEADVNDKPHWVRGWGTTTDPSDRETDNRAIFERTVDGIVYPGLQKQMLRTLKHLDDQIDLLLAKLEETGEADDTLVFYISDNGYQWREHASLGGDCIDSTAPGLDEVYRPEPCGPSAKEKPYLDSVRVPLIARWPDNPLIASGHSDPTKLVANIDVPTTVMDAVDVTPAGTAAEPVMDGRSLLDPWTRSWMLTEGWPTTQIPYWRALVNDTTHFIQTDDIPASTTLDESFLEWYDLTQDPFELDNRYGPGGAYDLPGEEPAPPLALLAQYASCAGATCP
jgi:arylsulfatase A-like enzyme